LTHSVGRVDPYISPGVVKAYRGVGVFRLRRTGRHERIGKPVISRPSVAFSIVGCNSQETSRKGTQGYAKAKGLKSVGNVANSNLNVGQ
jgi:hypothetical protein